MPKLCGSGFWVPVWQPVNQKDPTPGLLELKDRPPPSVRKVKRRKTVEAEQTPTLSSGATASLHDDQKLAKTTGADSQPPPEPPDYKVRTGTPDHGRES